MLLKNMLAQAVLALAWRAHLARKRVAAERLRKETVQRDARSLEQKRKEAQRLSAARRAQKPVQKRPVFGAHLSRLARSLPHHRPLSATLNDISPISSGPESSPKKSLPMEHLTSFQVKEVERVQAEYESARAATPSHQNEIFSQVGPALLLGRKFSNWPMNLSSPNKSAR